MLLEEKNQTASSDFSVGPFSDIIYYEPVIKL